MQKHVLEAVSIHEKKPRAEKIRYVKTTSIEHFAENYPGTEAYISAAVDEMVKKTMRSRILNERERADGRAMDEIRPITCEVEFCLVCMVQPLTRGETQALVVATLG